MSAPIIPAPSFQFPKLKHTTLPTLNHCSHIAIHRVMTNNQKCQCGRVVKATPCYESQLDCDLCKALGSPAQVRILSLTIIIFETSLFVILWGYGLYYGCGLHIKNPQCIGFHWLELSRLANHVPWKVRCFLCCCVHFAGLFHCLDLYRNLFVSNKRSQLAVQGP